jgi:hypothetical protein
MKSLQLCLPFSVFIIVRLSLNLLQTKSSSSEGLITIIKFKTLVPVHIVCTYETDKIGKSIKIIISGHLNCKNHI